MKEIIKKEKIMIKAMKDKLSIIMDKINNETNSKGVFNDKQVFLLVFKLDDEINDLWNSITHQTEDMAIICYTTITIVDEIIQINKKHYGYEETTNL